MYKNGLNTVSPLIDSQMRQLAFKKHISTLSSIKSDIDRSQPPPVGRLISYQKRMEQKRYTERLIEQENTKMIKESQKRSKSSTSKKSAESDHSNAWLKELGKAPDAKSIKTKPRTYPKNPKENEFQKNSLFDGKQSKYSDYYGVSKQEDEKKSVKHYPRKSNSAMQTINHKKHHNTSRQQQQQQEREMQYQESGANYQENDGTEHYYIDQEEYEEPMNQHSKQHNYKKNSNIVLHETFPDSPPANNEVFPTESKNFKRTREIDQKSLSQPVYYSKPLLVNTEEEEEDLNEVEAQIRKMLFHKF